MPKQSKFLLNIVCGTDNATGEIRGKVQCISSGQTAIFTNFKELSEFLSNEIQTLALGVESGPCEKEENPVSISPDNYPVIDYSKERWKPG